MRLSLFWEETSTRSGLPTLPPDQASWALLGPRWERSLPLAAAALQPALSLCSGALHPGQLLSTEVLEVSPLQNVLFLKLMTREKNRTK